MRSKLPVFWIAQFIVLVVVGLTSFFCPMAVLEGLRGEVAPRKVARPAESLSEWLLAIEEVPPPNETVQTFFAAARTERDPTRKIWTPSDRAVERFELKDTGHWHTATTENRAWDAFESWILSSKPSLSGEDRDAVKDWLHAIDEIAEPSPELIAWVADPDRSQAPPQELLLLVLNAHQVTPNSWQLAADQIRLASTFVFAFAFFTLLGLLSPSIRRPLARVFVLSFLFVTFALLRSSLGPTTWNLTNLMLIGGLIMALAMVLVAVRAIPRLTTGWTLWIVLTAWWSAVVVAALMSKPESGGFASQISLIATTICLAFFGVVNATYWLVGKREDPPLDDAGIAQRRPPQLWTLWFAQFVLLMSVGLSTLFFPAWTAEVFTNKNFDYITNDVVNDSVRILGACLISAALLTFFSLGVGRDWIWQGIGWIYCSVFAIMIVICLHNSMSGEYSIWGILYGFQGILFIPVTISLLFQKDPWSTQNVEKDQLYWSFPDLAVALPMVRHVIMRRKRRFFRHGIVVQGTMRVLSPNEEGGAESPGSGNQDVPASSYFSPGRTMPVLMRFANRTQQDDASLDIRGCALRVACCHADGPAEPSFNKCDFELMMATGSFSPTSSIYSFRRYMMSRHIRRRDTKTKEVREGLAAGMRRAPDSFLKLSYYNQLVLEWLTPRGDSFLVRFRVVPDESDGAKQGHPDLDDLRQLWHQARRNTEERSTDYLREGVRDEIAKDRVAIFRLEAQFKAPSTADSLDWYDASLEWDERAHPWTAVAQIELDEALEPEACNSFYCDLSDLTPAIRCPKSTSPFDIHDPRTLAAAQYRIASLIGEVRSQLNRSLRDDSNSEV